MMIIKLKHFTNMFFIFSLHALNFLMKFRFVLFSAGSRGSVGEGSRAAFVVLLVGFCLCPGRTCPWSQTCCICFRRISGIRFLKCRFGCRSRIHFWACLAANWSCWEQIRSRWSLVYLDCISLVSEERCYQSWAVRSMDLQPEFSPPSTHWEGCSRDHALIGPWHFQRWSSHTSHESRQHWVF